MDITSVEQHVHKSVHIMSKIWSPTPSGTRSDEAGR